MKVNIAKLRARMVELGYNSTRLAAAIGIHRSTFYRHLQAMGRNLTIGEVHKICDVLHLSSSEAACIFLSTNSQ